MSRHTEAERDGDGLSLVDCDVHSQVLGDVPIEEYLPEHYRERRGVNTPESSWSNPHGVARRDAQPAEGETAYEKLREQHFDRHGVDYGVLNRGPLALGVAPDADYAAAVARAHNEELVDRWLDRDDRFLGSMLVAPQAPEAAAAEIRRVGDHPRVVQVLLSSASGLGLPYGRRQFWPIYEAAAEVGLPVAIHPGTEGRGTARPPTGAGYPSRYVEWHTVLPANYVGHLTSLVTEGVFVEYPDLTFVCIEGGLAWVPHLTWRLDKNWRSLRVQTPWLERPPSEYLREHVRFTTQPVAEPEDPDHLRQILAMMHAEETVLFSSDYPHWDNDAPGSALPPLEEDLRRAIMYENARDLYDLPDDPAEL
ncbi:MAG: amidohydrolase family protein [Halobacteriaceae archaeon]